MNVLITAASRHGGTWEIAEVLGAELGQLGHDVSVVPVKDLRHLDHFDAVVIGSAVYMSRWMAEARQFIERNAPALRQSAVWLFSSGPLGADDELSDINHEAIQHLIDICDARGHATFSGRLELDRLKPGERVVARAVHAPQGDFRDWSDVLAWARVIASHLAVGTGEEPARRYSG